MYTITKTITKRSCKGKEFVYRKTVTILTDEEKRARAKANRIGKDGPLAIGPYHEVPACHGACIKEILSSYEEYVHNVRDFMY